MKLNAKYITHTYTRNHQAHLTLLIPNYRHMQMLNELSEDKNYSVELKVVKSQRSIEQNKLLWKLLHELEKVTHELAMEWYIKALIETGAVVDYVWGTVDTETTLQKSFRAVQKVKPYKIKDTDGFLYRVIVGSSKFNIEEMTRLIETVLRYCIEHNIETDTMHYD